MATEVEDLQLEVDRATAIANAAEKKQKAFDKIIGEWKLKVDDLAAELDASQKECRNYSTELFRLKGAYEEGQEQLEAVRRENKNLAGKHPGIQMPMHQVRYIDFWLQIKVLLYYLVLIYCLTPGSALYENSSSFFINYICIYKANWN